MDLVACTYFVSAYVSQRLIRILLSAWRSDEFWGFLELWLSESYEFMNLLAFSSLNFRMSRLYERWGLPALRLSRLIDCLNLEVGWYFDYPLVANFGAYISIAVPSFIQQRLVSWFLRSALICGMDTDCDPSNFNALLTDLWPHKSATTLQEVRISMS